MASLSEDELKRREYEDELNRRELALADAEATRRENALADADAEEAIATALIEIEEAATARVIQTENAAGVIQIEEDDETVKPRLRKAMAPRSEAWDHFTRVLDSKGALKEGLCKYCNGRIQATSSSNGTSSMLRHLTSCKKNPNRNHDPKQGTLQATPGASLNNWRYDPELLRKAFAQMVIEDELPFAFGEKSGFKKFMSIACPRFKAPSRRTCAREVVKIYLSEKAKLTKFFKENCASVCVTTDCWTSQQIGRAHV